MKKHTVSIYLILALTIIDSGCRYKSDLKFEPNWKSLNKYEIPQWFKDAKFGIFIHWGIYSVPAWNNEWYSRNMYVKGSPEYKHHIITYGDQSKFGYKDFIPMFKAEKWNPDEWAELFKQSGAKYVVPVAEHHDGFSMYASKINKWNAAEIGPKRDIIGELSRAVRKQGLVFGLSFHRAEHWWFMNGGKEFNSDVQDPKYADFYGPAQSESVQPDSVFLNDWLSRCKELVDNYQPQLVYFDWWVEQPSFKPYWREFASYYYNKGSDWDKGVVLNYKNEAFPENTAVLDVERGKLGKKRKLHWQTDTSIGKKSWCYVDSEEYKNSSQIILDLIDIVSKNGNLLLNIGPKSDGSIPQIIKQQLKEVGKWLSINGEGIYGTTPWMNFGEGPTQASAGSFSDNEKTSYTCNDYRFTLKGNNLYAFCMDWPRGKAIIKSLGKKAMKNTKVENVSLLGSAEKLSWRQLDNELEIAVPDRKPCETAFCFKIRISGTAVSDPDLNYISSDTIVADISILNCTPKEGSENINLLINGKTMVCQSATIKSLSIQDISFTYVQDQPGFYTISIACGKDTSSTSSLFLPGITAGGKWKFHKGTDDKWKDPDFKDDDWQIVSLPNSWEVTSNYTEDNVYGWYRKSIFIPKELAGHKLIIPLGAIDDADVSYLNGKRLGSTGSFPPNFKTAWGEQREYTAIPENIKYGELNVIAVKVFDGFGSGGIYKGPMGMIRVE